MGGARRCLEVLKQNGNLAAKGTLCIWRRHEEPVTTPRRAMGCDGNMLSRYGSGPLLPRSAAVSPISLLQPPVGFSATSHLLTGATLGFVLPAVVLQPGENHLAARRWGGGGGRVCNIHVDLRRVFWTLEETTLRHPAARGRPCGARLSARAPQLFL